MIQRDDVIDTLTKCAGYDPAKFPQPSAIMADAWCEHLDQFPTLTRQDLLEAVKAYYNTTERRVPQPADISRIARQIHRDRLDEEEARIIHEDICDRKAGDAPYSRRKINTDPATIEKRKAALAEFADMFAKRTPRQPALAPPENGDSPASAPRSRPKPSPVPRMPPPPGSGGTEETS